MVGLLVCFLEHRWSCRVEINKLFVDFLLYWNKISILFFPPEWKCVHHFLLTTKIWRFAIFFENRRNGNVWSRTRLLRSRCPCEVTCVLRPKAPPSEKLSYRARTLCDEPGHPFNPFQFSRSVMFDLCDPHGLQHARPPCPSPPPRVHSNCVHWVSDALQPSHRLSSPSPPTFNFSCHQGLFQRVSSSYQMAKVLEFQLQHQSFQWTLRLISFKKGWLDLLAVQGTLQTLPTPKFKSINSSALSFHYSPTLTSIHDHWKTHNFD